MFYVTYPVRERVKDPDPRHQGTDPGSGSWLNYTEPYGSESATLVATFIIETMWEIRERYEK
jgi:hypothetical protein